MRGHGRPVPRAVRGSSANGTEPGSFSRAEINPAEKAHTEKRLASVAVLMLSGLWFCGVQKYMLCVFVKGALRRTLARDSAPDGKRRLRAPGSGVDARPASRGWLRFIVIVSDRDEARGSGLGSIRAVSL